MGWAYGMASDGRPIGYGVEATCDEDGCTEQIDRGMAYLCGDLDGQSGCGRYFCATHLLFACPPNGLGQLCPTCFGAVETEPA
jgi:hypothetical protein